MTKPTFVILTKDLAVKLLRLNNARSGLPKRKQRWTQTKHGIAPINLIMKNPEWLETFIEEEGFTPIAEDQYECAGGHVWHIDEIADLWHQTKNAD